MPLAIDDMDPISVNLLRLHERKTKEARPPNQPQPPNKIDLTEYSKKYPAAGTLLTACVSNNDVSRVSGMMEKGVDPNSIDHCGTPMLSRACMNGELRRSHQPQSWHACPHSSKGRARVQGYVRRVCEPSRCLQGIPRWLDSSCSMERTRLASTRITAPRCTMQQTGIEIVRAS